MSSEDWGSGLVAMIRWPHREYWSETYPSLLGTRSLDISHVASLERPRDGAVIFATDLSEQSVADLARHHGCLLLLHQNCREISEGLWERHGALYSDDPRYQYAEVMAPLWDTYELRGRLSWDSARGIAIGKNVRIDSTAIIEPGVTIAQDSVVGPHVHIMTGARLGPRVRVGESTIIRENAVIGGWGFGFARAPGRPPIRIPHTGGVLIGSNVEIGALTTVCSGTIEPTIIADNVKTDDHVHIAHNCRIYDNVTATACAEVSGGVSVGRAAWLAPNCSIIDRITIGEGATVGMGAVVTRSVDDNATVVGNPARSLGK